MMKYLIITLMLSQLLVCNTVKADDETGWYLSASINMNFSVYSRPSNLDAVTELGIFVDADYLENYGLAAGLITQNRAQSSLGDIADGIFYLGGRYHFYPELLPGRLTLSMEAYDQDSLNILNPAITFMNYTKTFYAGLHYAESDYGSTADAADTLAVTQWAPAIGFAFNNQYDWLQLRYYHVELSSDARNPGVTKTGAGEFKLTHWFKQSGGLRPDRIQFIWLAGERIFAVDPDARKVYNFADTQTATYAAGVVWKPDYNHQFYSYASWEEYRAAGTNNDYRYGIVYAGYKIRW